MVTEVRIAEFKARMSEFLLAVRRGHEVIVKDRQTPVARIIPYNPPGSGFVTRLPTRTFREVEQLLASRARKAIRLKPGVLDRAAADSKKDWLDKWKASRSTSTPR